MSKYIVDIHGEIEGDYEIIGKYEEQKPATKNDSAHNLCDSCTNIRCEFQSGIVRTKCAFYMPPQHSSELEKEIGESDCISRKSVIAIIQNHWWNCRDIDKLVNELPPVTPIRPKGHWISRWHAGHDLHFHVCSECNEEFSCDMETGISIDNYRYCPNCGSDNREVEE